MPIILSISLRNLIRQKRRNVFLGIAIAFGTMILIMASSFAHGITDVLFNRIIKYANGHISVSYVRNGNIMNPLFPDADRIWSAIKAEMPNPELMQEAMGIFSRGIGNGKADNVIMVGIDLNVKMSAKDLDEYQANFKFISGQGFEGLEDSTIENPVALSDSKAKYLNLKVGDIIRVRFSDAHNQSQSAQLTVSGIFKPANIFMAAPIFLNQTDLHRIAGYGPHDVSTIQINIKNPQKDARALSDRIHARLKPSLGVIAGTLSNKKGTVTAIGLGMLADSVSHKTISTNILLTKGDSAVAFGRDGAIASYAIARSLGLNVGDTATLTWNGKFDSSQGVERIIISAIADSTAKIPAQAIMLSEKNFYNAFYRTWPLAPDSSLKQYVPSDTTAVLYAALAPEFRLMKRCNNTQEVMKIMREAGRAKYKGIMVQVQSMYETASDVLKLEAALTLITLIAVMILFFIILIGVVNTLRMTIRERTREIGTIRAIGMQKKDVRNVFVFETMFLALISAAVGIAGAFAGMAGLSALTIDGGENPMSMLLVKGHLHFVPDPLAIIFFYLFIVFIAMATAFFPARRAANMTAADALRHYE